MSKIGKKKIIVPNDCLVRIDNFANTVSATGKYGSLTKKFLNLIIFKQDKNIIEIESRSNTKFAKAYHGLIRMILNNMIEGVNNLFIKILVLEGVGYKFEIGEKSTFLRLHIGYTKNRLIEIPKNISIKLETSTRLVISGTDKEQINFFASAVRSFRPPEPYKGKGILYSNEKIVKKVGKRGK